MDTRSIWFDHQESSLYPSLHSDEVTDVAIIGGGITGVTTAELLAEAGLNVTILEANCISEGTTGRSTGNLYAMVDIFLTELIGKYDENHIAKILASRKEALKLIEENIRKYSIACDFEHVPWVVFSGTPEMDEAIQREYELAKVMGLNVQRLEASDELLTPFKGRVGLKVEHQAQFNPHLYTKGLLEAIQKKGCQVYEKSRVIDIEKMGDKYLLKTQYGSLKAKHLIEATHTPVGFSILQTVLGPYREYGVAGKADRYPHRSAIYWGHYEKGKVTSVRTYERDGEKYLIVVGQPHKVGQGDNEERIECLRQFGRKYFGVKDYTFQWGGQHYRPADYLPYIGKRHDSNSFLATGFSTDGLIYGTLSGMILRDQILGIQNEFEEIYRPQRFTPKKSMSRFMKENLNVMSMYVKDYLHDEKVKSLREGEGTIFHQDDHRYAISKTSDGELKVCSAICPHLGCQVHWNSVETTWDCPCHGSRFNQDGEVLEGPALKGLDVVEDSHIEIPREAPRTGPHA